MSTPIPENLKESYFKALEEENNREAYFAALESEEIKNLEEDE